MVTGDVPNTSSDNAGSERVSVVVCTRNRAGRLARLVRALLSQTVPTDRYEIVIVDDGSVDGTSAVCRRLQDEVPNLRCIRATGTGLGRARNDGIEASRTDAIVFIDDDCIPHTDWLEHMLAALQDEPIVAGAVDDPGGSFWRLCHNVAEFHQALPCRKPGPGKWIANANAGYRAEVWEEVGGFDTELPRAADMDFVIRARAMGYRPYFEPRAVVDHYSPRMSLREVLRYSAKHAATTIRLRLQDDGVTHTPRLLRRPLILFLAAPAIALWVTGKIFAIDRRMLRRLHTAPFVYAQKAAWCLGAAWSLWKNPLQETNA